MNPSKILLALAASVGLASAVAIPNPAGDVSLAEAPLEKRTCYSTGEKYGNYKGEAQELARTACRTYFRGEYKKGNTYNKCYNLPNGNSVNFSVGLLGQQAGSRRYLGEDECYSGLSKEVTGCDRGGKTTYGNWMYK
ncbi:hypothetical protein F5X68DRAFT_192973 [Plectosphaerella plurivora]|uniref:Secreted protein n=1 Tax=Plectosphaerella plurivora TaxID=936078 RepID=A0A9P9A932_9PEZI|nr:hypothetical protein F5X68DRAFT_192973 [Plectosphaerella plurivora]